MVAGPLCETVFESGLVASVVGKQPGGDHGEQLAGALARLPRSGHSLRGDRPPHRPVGFGHRRGVQPERCGRGAPRASACRGGCLVGRPRRCHRRPGVRCRRPPDDPGPPPPMASKRNRLRAAPAARPGDHPPGCPAAIGLRPPRSGRRAGVFQPGVHPSGRTPPLRKRRLDDPRGTGHRRAIRGPGAGHEPLGVSEGILFGQGDPRAAGGRPARARRARRTARPRPPCSRTPVRSARRREDLPRGPLRPGSRGPSSRSIRRCWVRGWRADLPCGTRCSSWAGSIAWCASSTRRTRSPRTGASDPTANRWSTSCSRRCRASSQGRPA